MLISEKPNSKGKEAVIFRSRQLTEFEWTPVCDIPVYTKKQVKPSWLKELSKRELFILQPSRPTNL